MFVLYALESAWREKEGEEGGKGEGEARERETGGERGGWERETCLDEKKERKRS